MEALTEAVQLLAAHVKELCRKQAESQKVVIFIDNSNLYGSVARLGQVLGHKYRIDYHKLYRILLEDRFCIKAICFCPEWDADNDQRSKRDNFQTMMQKSGFLLSRIPQKTGSVREKGLDAAIVREMITMASECHRANTFILVAGDGDYSDTVRELRHKYGIMVEVAFFNQETASSLKEAAYKFINLDSIAAQIQLDRSSGDTI